MLILPLSSATPIQPLYFGSNIFSSGEFYRIYLDSFYSIYHSLITLLYSTIYEGDEPLDSCITFESL